MKPAGIRLLARSHREINGAASVGHGLLAGVIQQRCLKIMVYF